MAAAYSPKSVQEVWDNHFKAFGGHNLDDILLDYCEQSVINVYDHVSGNLTVHKGLAGVRECFRGLFETLVDMSGTTAPVQEVDEVNRTVFLIWQVLGSGYHNCCDTFVLSPELKIVYQNVAVRKIDK